MKMMLRKQQHSAGFTLIELMVSLMIFTIVVLAAVGSLYTVNTASRKVQAMRSVLDNVTFAVESMSRTIRTGKYVVCGGVSNISNDPNCPFSSQTPSQVLLVDSTLGVEQRVEYRLGINSNGTGNIEKRVEDCTSGACVWLPAVSLTAPEVNIQNLSFYVSGADITDGTQTSVMLFINGVASTIDDTTPFALQTFISERATE